MFEKNATDKQTDNYNFLGRSSRQWQKIKFGKLLLSLRKKK